MSLGKFFKKIGGAIANFFKDLFASAKKVWNKLEPSVKDAILFGSGVVEFINTNKELIPSDLRSELLGKFGLSDEQLNEILDKASLELNLVGNIANATPSEKLAAIQNYLSSKSGADWATASDTLAKIIAVFKAPKETKTSVIIQLMVFAYQTFIKKR